MLRSIGWAFSIEQYFPQSYCYSWQVSLMGLHIISDALIALAYFLILITQVYFAGQRQGFLFNLTLPLVGSLAAVGGAIHILAIWSLWHPIHWILGGVKAINAVIAIVSAIVLIRIFPRILSIFTRTDQLRAINHDLLDEIRERKRIERALRKSQEQFQLLAENMTDLVCLHSPQGQFLYVGPSCYSLTGFQPEELLYQDANRIFQVRHRHAPEMEENQFICPQQVKTLTCQMQKKSEEFVWLEVILKPIFSQDRQISYLQSTSRDITEKILIREQLEHDAMHDDLTGLPNRNLLVQRLELAVGRMKRHPEFLFSVLFIDLDRFKAINDSLGHLVGDQLLQQVARELQQIIRTTDLVARMGGDEFVILLEELQDVHEVTSIAQRVLHTLESPFLIQGHQVCISASIGIMLGAKSYSNSSEILRDADIALYRAKEAGKARYEIFDPEMRFKILDRLQTEQNIREALENQEFVLHYQPIISLTSGELVGFEALIRWQQTDGEIIPPAQFIPIAEDTGLIVPIGIWVLEEACQTLANWQDQLPDTKNLHISINLSLQQLMHFDFMDQVDRILSQTGLSGKNLMLEVTENTLAQDVSAITEILNRLEERSVQVSIDDFGTGLSSLNYLHQFPVKTLKIDRSFIENLNQESWNCKIVATIITLANQLNIQAVAEGIETEEQLSQLRTLGCDLGQGYLFDKPLPQLSLKNGFSHLRIATTV
ncbi:MAG: putative bifunctional diguanylate cyclase/phosphodiesterase [Microcoleaceae cyanobacterium]